MYTPFGYRSRQIVERFDSRTGAPIMREGYYALRDEIYSRYEEEIDMGCCVKRSDVNVPPNGKRVKGDVKAIALWPGNRIVTGPVTGRVYRGGNRRLMWVALQDAQAAPERWKVLHGRR
jgi:hypothetical protein